MSRRRRHRLRFQPQGMRKSGREAGLLLLFLVGVVETAGPTLCREAPAQPLVADAGVEEFVHLPPPIHGTAWADAATDDNPTIPRPIQKTPPCYNQASKKVQVIDGKCWVLVGEAEDCPAPGVIRQGRCYVGQPVMPDGPPVSGAP